MTTLFHVSDLHFGREDRAAIDWFADVVRAERPAAVLLTGDLTMRARSHEWKAAADWLAGLQVPLSIDVGNHDLPYFNLWQRFVTPYARYEKVERALERPLDLPDVATISLRTTARFQWRTNWSHGVVTHKRLTQTIATLNRASPNQLKLVTCHHPLIDKPGGEAEGRTRGGRDALVSLAAAGADAILSGHVHDPFDIVWEGGPRPVRLIGAGTLSERVRSTPPSFNQIEAKDGALSVLVRTMT